MSKKSRPCEICMKPIESERLETIPETRLCVEHAEKIKKFGGEFTGTATEERLSKKGSIKHNVGGVGVTFKRNLSAINKLKDEYEEEKWI